LVINVPFYLPKEKMKTVAFLIDKELGVSLTLWALRHKLRKAKVIILCRKENRKYFKKFNVKFVKNNDELFSANPDIAFSINYWKKIEKKYVQQVKIINLHHSYNLLYRGRHTCSWAIINARKTRNMFHGTTLHIIDENLDCGRIIVSRRCRILESDTAYSLFLRVEKLAKDMFKEKFSKILHNKYRSRPVRHSRFCYKAADLSHCVDLNLSALDIYDRVRALTFPGKPLPYAIIKNKKIELVLNKK